MMTLEIVARAEPKPALDLNKYGNPLVSVIVTHYNYSSHLEDALRSLIDQTHTNWECIVIDDASDKEHAFAAERIVNQLYDPRITFFRRIANAGQIWSFYTGVGMTKGHFVCLLDPDDRYAPNFLASMIDAHLNESVFCPIVSSDQCLVAGDTQITGIYGAYNASRLGKDRVIPNLIEHKLVYYPAHIKGWPWTSTSAMMFRRPALALMQPRKGLAYKGSADSYLAQGAHRLGGSLYLNQPLVYRLSHASNAWLTDGVFAMSQKRRREGAQERGKEALADVLEAIRVNGGASHLIYRPSKPGLFGRLKRSLQKRWSKL
jgi:glycosyltransferase involved in cell wall biosynthesis